MLHDFYHESSAGNEVSGRDYQEAWRQNELIGGKRQS
jgi:hypothetical protein